MLSIKSKMMPEDEQQHIFKCGQIWRGYLAEQEVVVVTKHAVCPTDLFGQFYDVIKLGIDKGLVELLTLSEVEEEHLSKIIVEF